MSEMYEMTVSTMTSMFFVGPFGRQGAIWVVLFEDSGRRYVSIISSVSDLRVYSTDYASNISEYFAQVSLRRMRIQAWP
jgi:hypothetical protein